jgi:hypothetical protein
MNKKHRKTLEKIYQATADIKWNDFLSLIKHLGGEVEQGAGSRCRIWLNDRAINLHKPHPQPEIKRYAVRQVREFLKNMEIEP